MDKETINFPEVGYCKTKDLGLINTIIKFSGARECNRHKIEDFNKDRHIGIAWNLSGDKDLKFWFIVTRSSLPEISVSTLKELLRNSIINTVCKHSLETGNMTTEVNTTLLQIEPKTYSKLIKSCSQTINIERKQQLKFKFKNIKITQLCQNSKNNLKFS